jgi:thioredoxin reductase
VLASSEFWFHQAMLIPEWGRTTLFTNGIYHPDAEQRTVLAARDVSIEETPVLAVGGARATMQLEDGRSLPLEGLFLIPRTRFTSAVVEGLGCALEVGHMGPFIRTDARKETSVPGVFACGDVARAAGSVSLAVGDGAMTGTAVHQSLVFR